MICGRNHENDTMRCNIALAKLGNLLVNTLKTLRRALAVVRKARR